MNGIPARPPVQYTKFNDGLDHIREGIAEADVAAGRTVPLSTVLAHMDQAIDEMRASRAARKTGHR